MESSSGGSNSGSNSQKIWRKLWGLNAPNKIKVLLWRACNSFLPCLGELKQWKLCENSKCGGCGSAMESVLHVLWECSFAQKVWSRTFLSKVCKVWKENSFFDLFAHVGMVANGDDLEWFGVICWRLWQWRNDRVHGRFTGNVVAFFTAVECWWEVWRGSWKKDEKGLNSNESNVNKGVKERWRLPSPGRIKLNVDGGLDQKNGLFGT
ncbi:hypothetical protein ACLB2K_009315 [Fragaria x ananassa]